jgi:hypothetical protein
MTKFRDAILLLTIMGALNQPVQAALKTKVVLASSSSATLPIAISTYPAILPSPTFYFYPALSVQISTGSMLAPVSLSSSTSITATQALLPPSLYSTMAPEAAAKTVSLDLRDMDVVEVLKTLSKQQGINLVIDKNVSGRVTLLLKNVEFWEALRAILNSRDLAYAKEGNFVTAVL